MRKRASPRAQRAAQTQAPESAEELVRHHLAFLDVVPASLKLGLCRAFAKSLGYRLVQCPTSDARRFDAAEEALREDAFSPDALRSLRKLRDSSDESLRRLAGLRVAAMYHHAAHVGDVRRDHPEIHDAWHREFKAACTPERLGEIFNASLGDPEAARLSWACLHGAPIVPRSEAVRHVSHWASHAPTESWSHDMREAYRGLIRKNIPGWNELRELSRIFDDRRSPAKRTRRE